MTCSQLFSFSGISLDSACAVRVFSEFRDTGNKYKMRIRSRVANLGDLKNPSLRQNVINGHVPPSRIAVMTSEVCYHQNMCEDTVASALASSPGSFFQLLNARGRGKLEKNGLGTRLQVPIPWLACGELLMLYNCRTMYNHELVN